MAVGSQLFASVLLLPLVPLALPSAGPSARVIVCVLALALFCTALAYVLYFRLIVDVGPTRAITVTFLIPISGVVWAALFLGEDIQLGTLLGCGIILVGTALVTGVRPGRIRVAPRLGVEGDRLWEDA
jgi:drug/metabolite transporter (DMT)-like permease